MDIIPATEEEKQMARQFYGTRSDFGVKKLSQAIMRRLTEMETQSKFNPGRYSIPVSQYSENYQEKVNDLIDGEMEKRHCSRPEAVVRISK